MTRASLWFASAMAGALASACFTTTVTSGRPAGPATVAYDARWHHGVVEGLGEISGPYDLSAICPQGWAEIETETSFPNVVAEIFSGGSYSPQTVTIRCAAVPMRPPPPPPVAPPAP